MEKKPTNFKDAKNHIALRISLLASLAIGGLGIAGCTSQRNDEALDSGIELAASTIGGEVQIGGCSIIIPSGANLRSTPAVINASQFGEGVDNYVGTVPEGQSWMVSNPFVAMGSNPSAAGSSGKTRYYGYLDGNRITWVCSDLTGVSTAPGCQNGADKSVAIAVVGDKGEPLYDAGNGSMLPVGQRTVVKAKK
jgi:hypothetical protein